MSENYGVRSFKQAITNSINDFYIGRNSLQVKT